MLAMGDCGGVTLLLADPHIRSLCLAEKKELPGWEQHAANDWGFPGMGR